MATSKTPTRVAHRSAVDGQFITKKQADRNPRESVKERIPVPKPPKR
ncbi:multidrug transporter [Pseudoduganella lutea]|uniref:Multidrug transporter n=1 Tax=Pseudoduganella lutea TaxID=321985 RepID=A0A4P6L057_9BURK|nr:multidrug transporter [Pseudoduganella lutea]